MKGAKERHEARVNRWKNDASVKRALRQPAETVKLAIRKSNEYNVWFEPIGTIDLVDGEPDVDSIKMEKLP